MIMILDDHEYIICDDFLSEKDRQLVWDDVLMLIDSGYVNHSDLALKIQTPLGLYEQVKGVDYWDNLYNKVCNTIDEKHAVYHTSWAYLTNKHSSKDNLMHNHTGEDRRASISAVYYVHSEYSEYGLNIENKFIIPSIQNRLLVFNGDVDHAPLVPPDVLMETDRYVRCSIVFDFYFGY